MKGLVSYMSKPIIKRLVKLKDIMYLLEEQKCILQIVFADWKNINLSEEWCFLSENQGDYSAINERYGDFYVERMSRRTKDYYTISLMPSGVIQYV